MSYSSLANQDVEELSSPLEYLLTSGGDPRLRVDAISLLNGYGCQPWPRPEAFTFASSTATSISKRGFAAASEAQRQLIETSHSQQLEDACDQQAQSMREQIKTFLKLGASESEIVFSPSGTDSQVHALYIAQTLLDGPLVTVIVGSDETGSGTSRAMTGCHFSSGTAQGSAVLDGKRIAGFAEDIARIEIPLRDENGNLRSSDTVDHEVLGAVAQSVASGKRVVLHVMDTSKFGSRCPSPGCLRQVQSNWGRSVQVVVDACQMRLSRRRLQYYLAQNFMVFITGSKFLTGPPLSGALLIPAGVSALMKENVAFPTGLELYSNQTDWPIGWHGIRSKLVSCPNVGQLLRWAAAVEELKAYFSVPDSYRFLALQEFSRVVPGLIAERPNLQLLPAFENADADGIDDEEMAARTIFPFYITCRGKFLSLEACAHIYRALNIDVSDLLPRSATVYQRQVAARLCHIGQPVKMSSPTQGIVGTLRISAGARVVSDTWCSAGATASLRALTQEFEQVRTILDKIDLLVQNIDTLEKMDEAKKKTVTPEADSIRPASMGTSGKQIHPQPAHALSSVAIIPPTSGAKHG